MSGLCVYVFFLQTLFLLLLFRGPGNDLIFQWPVCYQQAGLLREMSALIIVP